MSYSILTLRRAQKQLEQVPGKDYQRVKEAINSLAQEPRPRGCSKLVAREGWRIRVGDYRVIYEIDDSQQVVTVLHVGNRRDIYS